MIQPPKMSPFAFESAGIGMTRSTSSRWPAWVFAGLDSWVMAFTWDNAMAIFGPPRPHETHAARNCHAFVAQ